MAQGLSVALPLRESEEDGKYAIHKNLMNVAEQNLKMVILTSPGERVMDPSFGVGIRKYLFERSSNSLDGEIKSRVKSQVKKYVPYVKILGLSVNQIPDEGVLFLKIRYSVPKANAVSDLTIPVSL